MYVRRLIQMITAALAVLVLMAGMVQAAPAKAKTQPVKPTVKITVAQANATVLKKFPGKIVGKTKLENEEGVWQYGVMVQSGKKLREVMVNAKTGKIDSIEVTTAAKEGIESKAEAAKEKAAAKPTKPRAAKPVKVAPKTR